MRTQKIPKRYRDFGEPGSHSHRLENMEVRRQVNAARYWIWAIYGAPLALLFLFAGWCYIASPAEFSYIIPTIAFLSAGLPISSWAFHIMFLDVILDHIHLKRRRQETSAPLRGSSEHAVWTYGDGSSA